MGIQITKYRFIRLGIVQLFAPCLLPLPSYLGNIVSMARHTLHAMQDAFPDGFPPALPGLLNLSSIDYNQFAMYYHTAEIGSFKIPIANINIHAGQRPLEPMWVKDLMLKFAAGIQLHANFGVALLTLDIPMDVNGKSDGSQMHVSNICGLHCCTAHWNMNGPDDKKIWFFHVYKFSLI